jgi:cell division septal protein FtsQ
MQKPISPDRETQTINSYSKRKLGQLKKRRDLRKTKISMVRFRFFARVIAILALIFGFSKVVDLPQWYLDKNIFAYYPNYSVEIKGNSIVSEQQIMQKLKNIKIPDKPVYLVDTKPIEKQILKLVPVKKVFIRRYWFPARLRIVVDERTPVLAVAPTPKAPIVAVFTNDEGTVKILNNEYLPLPSSIKSVYKIISYDANSMNKLSSVEYLTKFAIYTENATGQKLEYLDIRNPDDVFVQLKEVKLRIGKIKGISTFANVDKVISALPEAMKIKNQIEYIDLRWDDVSIKLKDKNKETKKEPAKKEA